MRLWRTGRKHETDNLADDEAFWSEQRTLVLGTVKPIFKAAFVAGALLGSQHRKGQKAGNAADIASALGITGTDAQAVEGEAIAEMLGIPGLVDVDRINRIADDFIRAYADDWWQGLSTVRRDALRTAILRARAEGLGPEWVAGQIESLFGIEASLRVAVTELTNLMGKGAQAEYAATGYAEWDWLTAEDEDVDEECESMAQGSPYPMSMSFEAAHPNCRCWPAPSGDLPEIALVPVADELTPESELPIL